MKSILNIFILACLVFFTAIVKADWKDELPMASGHNTDIATQLMIQLGKRDFDAVRAFFLYQIKNNPSYMTADRRAALARAAYMAISEPKLDFDPWEKVKQMKNPKEVIDNEIQVFYTNSSETPGTDSLKLGVNAADRRDLIFDFLGLGMDPNAGVRPPLLFAIQGLGGNYYESSEASGIVRVLVERGADINYRDPKTGNTLLHEVILELQKLNDDVHRVNKVDLLMLTPEQSSPEEIARLQKEAQEKNTKVIIKNPESLQPIIDEKASQLLEIFKMLLKFGVNPNRKNSSGQTPLDLLNSYHSPYLADFIKSAQPGFVEALAHPPTVDKTFVGVLRKKDLTEAILNGDPVTPAVCEDVVK